MNDDRRQCSRCGEWFDKGYAGHSHNPQPWAVVTLQGVFRHPNQWFCCPECFVLAYPGEAENPFVKIWAAERAEGYTRGHSTLNALLQWKGSTPSPT